MVKDIDPKTSGPSPLIWRKYHGDGTVCPSAGSKARPAQFANPGERKPTLGHCGCAANHPGSYYQADPVMADAGGPKDDPTVTGDDGDPA